MNLFSLTKLARGRGRSSPLMGDDGESHPGDKSNPYLPSKPESGEGFSLIDRGSEGFPGENPNVPSMGGRRERDDLAKVEGHEVQNNPKTPPNNTVPESYHSLLNERQEESATRQSDFGEGVADRNTFDDEQGGIADKNLGITTEFDAVGKRVPKNKGILDLQAKPQQWSAFDQAKNLKGI